MENLILIMLIIGIVGGAAYYIYRTKKKGEACIGCPHTKTCQHHKCAGACSIGVKDDK